MSTETISRPLPSAQSRTRPDMGGTSERPRSTASVGSVVYGLVAYGWFLVTLLYTIGFVGNLLVPRSIDYPQGLAAPWAVAINSFLLATFGVQHSVMARPAFKRWWITIVPRHLERSTFVLVTNVLFAGLFFFWQSIPGTVWEVTSLPVQIAVWCLFGAGLVVALLSTFLIDHFELFGVRQVLAAVRGQECLPPTFHVRGLYRYVRHPLMLGFLTAFWATPHMTHGHLLFASGITIYVLIALRLEERDLRQFHGDAYQAYQQRVPMLVPQPGRFWQADSQG